MRIDVCHSLTGELLDIELSEGALVEELRNVLKVRALTHDAFLEIFQPMQRPNLFSEQKQTGVELESQVPRIPRSTPRADRPHAPSLPSSAPTPLTHPCAQVLICEWGPE